MSSLQGMTVVVTGASAGIGAAIARALAARGARLVLTARRADRLKVLADEIGSDVIFHAADIADANVPKDLLDLATSRFGGADVLINNAGIFRNGTVQDFDLGSLSSLIAVNYEAVVRASYIFARYLKERGKGSIINISSIGANLTAPGSGVYGGLKKALEIYSDALRIELADSGVRVGIVAPGSTATEIFDHLDSKPGGQTPMTPLQPEDVASAVCFLLEQPDHANVPHLRIYASGQRH